MTPKSISTAIPCNITRTEREALAIVAADLKYKSVSALVRECLFEKHGEMIRAIELDTANRRNARQSRTLKQA